MGHGGGIHASISGTLSLNNSTVEDNRSTGKGGGIHQAYGNSNRNLGRISLSNSTVSGNSTTGGGAQGGGIYANTGNVSLVNSTVSDNSTSGRSAVGGGIRSRLGDVSLTDSTVSGNSTAAYEAGGGGISATNVNLTGSTVSFNSTAGESAYGGGIQARDVSLTNSTVTGNSTAGDNAEGGGIFAFYASLTHSTLSDNSTSGANSDGGGIMTVFDLSATNSTVSDNSTTGDDSDGGGIWNLDNGVSLTNSTLSGNSTAGVDSNGGGVYSRNTVSLTNSTVSGNSTTASATSGGGIYSWATVSLTNSTVTGNSSMGRGGGVDLGLAATRQLRMNSSILAGNTAPMGRDYGFFPYGNLLSPDIRYSLIGNTAGTQIQGGTGPGNLLNVSPRLGPLADNGGPTLTHSLLPDSPAINSGNPSIAAGFDQRGTPFERVVDGRADMGAFEAFFIEVNSNGDVDDGDIANGVTTLREAINFTNLRPSKDQISFSSLFDTTQTIDLNSQLPNITDAVSIIGPGAALLTIDAGNGTDNTFGTGDGFRIFNSDDGDGNTQLDVTISGLSISGGDVAPGDFQGDGGAIRNRENLTLSDSVVSGNAAVFGDGGGIENRGELTVTTSTIAENQASLRGGGIVHVGFYGSLSVRDSTLSGNAARDGGGIHSAYSLPNSQSSTTIINSTLSGNTATAQGGGLYSSKGNMVVESSTITANTAPSGRGGGVASSGYASTQTEVHNSIIAGNINNDVAVVRTSQSNSFVSGGYNLLGSGGGALNGLANFTAAGDQRNVTNPRLGPLSDNGGTTQTHALLFDSPAKQAGDPSFDTNAWTPALVDDQRGGGFQRVAIGRIDIGAFELQDAPPVFTSPDNASQRENSTNIILVLSATDINSPDQTVTFSIAPTGVDNDFFDLTGTELRFIAVRDFETPADANGDNVYEVTVLASDGVNATPQTISVTVTDGPDTFVVDTTIDENDGDFSPGDLSLREALELANMTSTLDTITFDPAVFTGGSASLIRLSEGTLQSNRPVIIDGSTGVEVTITGDALGNDTLVAGTTITDVDASLLNDPASMADNFRVLNASANPTKIIGLTLTGGRDAAGAGLRFSGSGLDLRDSTVSGNRGAGVALPGGYNNLILGSVISGNRGSGNGGGIEAGGSALVIYGSTISDNEALRGGGIYASSGNLLLRNSVVSNNKALNGPGGGISHGATQGLQRNITISGSTISGNTSHINPQGIYGFRMGGGGIFSFFATLNMYDSTVSGNTVSGIAIRGSNPQGGQEILIPAGGGGVFVRGGDTRITRSTVTGNSAPGKGGAIYAHNAAIGVNAGVVVRSSVVADSTSGDGLADIWRGAFGAHQGVSITESLIDDTTGIVFNGGSNNNILNQPALLGPLADNGGSTLSHALLPGSPAIDAVDLPSVESGFFEGNFGGFSRLGSTSISSEWAFRGNSSARLAGNADGGSKILIQNNQELYATNLNLDVADVLPGSEVVASVAALIGEPLASGQFGEFAIQFFRQGFAGINPPASFLNSTPISEVRVTTADEFTVPGEWNHFELTATVPPGAAVAVILLTYEGESNAIYYDDVFSSGQKLARSEFDVRGPSFYRFENGRGDMGSYEYRHDPPVFTSPAAVAMAENTTVVQTLTAVNAGASVPPFTFAIANRGADDALFEIVGDELRFISPPDFEARQDFDRNNEYRVNVQVTDAIGGVTHQRILVSVTDVEDAIVVSTTADESDGDFSAGNLSLREAIEIANANPSPDTIAFNALFDASQTILLGSQLPTITDDLTIIGPGADLLTIDAGNGSDNTFNTGDGFRLFNIDDGDANNLIDVAISGLTLNGADVSGNGGAINSVENLSLVSSTLSGNAASGLGGGLSQLVTGSLTVTDSTLSGNAAQYGGGVFSWNDLADQTTTITGSTISGNTVTRQGGGIFNRRGLTVIRSSTITNNNSPTGFGSGVASRGDAQTRTEVTGSIIAGNLNNNDLRFVSGSTNSFLSGGYNLIGVGSIDTFTATGDQTNVTDPRLGPLADNGGPTLTHPLLLGSPAINAGDPNAVAGVGLTPLFDQRGAGFDRVFNRMDIGAFERQTEFPSLIVTIATDVVDNSDSETSLREAINFANSQPGAATITFSTLFDTAQTILLGSQLPTITDDLTISGPGANLLTIDAGGGTNGVIGNADGFRLLNVDDGDANTQVEVALSGLTLTGGDVSNADLAGEGGAIRNLENLTLNGIAIQNNSARNNGGGVFNDGGLLSINQSTVSGNRALFNRGGGIYTRNGMLNITDSTVSGNQSANAGGGISSNTDLAGQITTITSSTISGNVSTGGLGGGLFNTDGLTVIQSSTITDNAAGANRGSGVASRGNNATRTEVSGSIIAGNTHDDVAVTNFTTNNSFVSGGYNLIGSGGGTLNGIANFNAIGDQTNVTDPLLGPLTDNGGPTQTHALLVGSPAIDAGDPSSVAGQNGVPVFDQRGSGFARVVSGTIDIGAFEFPDTVAPTADIVDVTPDPRNTAVGVVTIDFNEDVSGFDLSDLLLTRVGVPVDIVGLTLIEITPRQYTIDLSSVTNSDGDYELTVESAGSGIQDSAGNAMSTDAVDQFMIDTVGPQVESVVINGGDAQRSMVAEITVTFSEPVLGVDENSFVLMNTTTNTQVVPLVSTQLIDGKTVATLTFSGSGIIGGSLSDGNYTLTTLTGGLSDAAGNQLDGNGDGTSGDDATDEFFRFFGDFDGDRDVDAFDFIHFRRTYRRSFGDALFNSAMDADGDGDVDARDFVEFRRRYRRSLP